MFYTSKKDFFSYGDNEKLIHWKAFDFLTSYMTRFGSIKPSKYTGNNVKHQKMVRKAIIRARELGVLPYHK